MLLVAACAEGESQSDKKLAAGDELWVIETRVWGTEDATGYAIPASELKGDFGTDDAIEQAGGGLVFAHPTKLDGSFLLSDGESGTLVGYQVSADNEIEQGESISFEGDGVQNGYGAVAWVDDHTAYWLDSSLLLAIRFDPADMKVEKTIPIEGVAVEGFRAWFSDRPVVRQDGVFVTINWSSDWTAEELTKSPKGSKLVHIDPKTDKVTITSDDRCTSLLTTMTTPDGDSYFFSSWENAYARVFSDGEAGVPDCALRVRKGETTFDPAWYLDISERTGGRPADGILPGGGSTIWLRAYHADEVDEKPSEFEQLDTAAAWQWYKLDVERDDPAEENSERPFSAHGTSGFEVHGRSFATVPNEDYSESELLELEGDKLVPVATVVGELAKVVRVR